MFKKLTCLKGLKRSENISERTPLTPPDSPSTSGQNRYGRNYGTIVNLLKRTLSTYQQVLPLSIKCLNTC